MKNNNNKIKIIGKLGGLKCSAKRLVRNDTNTKLKPKNKKPKTIKNVSQIHQDISMYLMEIV